MAAPRIYARAEWGAKPPESVQFFRDPVSTVFVHTSVTTQLPASASVKQETEQMRLLQAIAFGRGFDDISYSYVVFPSGRIYEGRGRRRVQAATEGHNSTSYSVCTGGNTDTHRPTFRQRRAIRKLIDYLQQIGAVTRKCNVRGHREVAPKACPGAKFTDRLLTAIQRAVNND